MIGITILVVLLTFVLLAYLIFTGYILFDSIRQRDFDWVAVAIILFPYLILIASALALFGI